MTTDPTASSSLSISKAMPVMLMTADDLERWLTGGSVEDAQSMQRPAADDALTVGPPVNPEKKAGLPPAGAPSGSHPPDPQRRAVKTGCPSSSPET
jgi:hypothetical protein